jgi:hypothetical protein
MCLFFFLKREFLPWLGSILFRYKYCAHMCFVACRLARIAPSCCDVPMIAVVMECVTEACVTVRPTTLVKAAAKLSDHLLHLDTTGQPRCGRHSFYTRLPVPLHRHEDPCHRTFQLPKRNLFSSTSTAPMLLLFCFCFVFLPDHACLFLLIFCFDFFRQTYGNDWLRFWNLVHNDQNSLQAFVKVVTSEPPSVQTETTMAMEQKQRDLFTQVFGDNWERAWDMIMTNTTAQQRFAVAFTAPPGTFGDSSEPGIRGAGLPPPPPIARDAVSVIELYEIDFNFCLKILFVHSSRVYQHSDCSRMCLARARDLQRKCSSWATETDATFSLPPSLNSSKFATPEHRSKAFLFCCVLVDQ